MWRFGGYGFTLKGYDKRDGLQFHVLEHGLEPTDGAYNLKHVDHAIYRLVNLEHNPPFDSSYPMRQVLPLNFRNVRRSFYEYPHHWSWFSTENLKEQIWDRSRPYWSDSY